MALLKSLSSWGRVMVLAGFTTGYGAEASAGREGDAGSPITSSPVTSSPISRGPALGIGGMGIGGTGRSAFGERSDVPAEALATALSSGGGLGGEISRPLPAL